MRLQQLCRGGARQPRGERRGHRRVQRQLPLVASPHRDQGGRDRPGHTRRRRRGRRGHQHGLLPRRRLRGAVRRDCRAQGHHRQPPPEGDTRDGRPQERRKHQARLDTGHVQRRRLHQDLDRQDLSRGLARGCLCDVPVHQGVLPEAQHHGGLQGLGRHTHHRGCREVLHHRQGGAGRPLARQRGTTHTSRPSTQQCAPPHKPASPGTDVPGLV